VKVRGMIEGRTFGAMAKFGTKLGTGTATWDWVWRLVSLDLAL
jgi:hypothetical protein